MITTSFINDCIIYGASVIGKSHILNHTCNQDFHRIKRTRYGIAMSVCDGVGSEKYSQYGSKAASKAVIKVFKLYYHGKISKDSIGEKIEFYYRKYLWPMHRSAAGTTCLFALVYADNEVIIGQAGDGVILIKSDEKFVVFQNKTDDFMNEVSALTCKRPYKHWKVKNLRFDFHKNKELKLLLSTDGISEDIIPEKREMFLEHFIGLTKSNNRSGLLDELKNWSVPGSIDDKTVITFAWRNNNGCISEG